MGTYMDSSGEYRNYENKVIQLLKTIAQQDPESAAAQAIAAAEAAVAAAAAVESAVLFTEQSLTDIQKGQARTNIGAAAEPEMLVPDNSGYIAVGTGDTVAVDENGKPTRTAYQFTRYMYADCVPGERFMLKTSGTWSITNVKQVMFLGAAENGAREILSMPRPDGVLSMVEAPEDAEMIVLQATPGTLEAGTIVYYRGSDTGMLIPAPAADGTYALRYTAEDGVNAFSLEEVPGEVTVTGSTPSITAAAGTRYKCTGTVTEISVTPCATGLCEVTFTTGSTPVWNTTTGAVMPDWFTGLEAGYTYEMSFRDGYGAVMSWPAT